MNHRNIHKMELSDLLIVLIFLGILEVSLTQDTSSDTDTDISLANNKFAIDLLHEISSEAENQFFSPLSIMSAFAALSLGAREETLQQINSAFHFDEIEKSSSESMALHKAFKTILDVYGKQNASNSVTIANGLFEQIGYDIKSKFQSDAQKYYDAKIEEVDFASANTANNINQWVEEQTNGKIKNLFEPGSLSADTILAIVNAIYFKGNWKTRFDKSKTHEMDFFISNNDSKKVEMMNVESKFFYNEDDDLKIKILRMPYEEDELSMTIILPEQSGLSEVIEKLDAHKLKALDGELNLVKVNVTLPTFKLETSYSLQDSLQSLGIKDLFTFDANLEGISEGPTQVSKVFHKAYLKIDEEGTTAAAATGIAVNYRFSATDNVVYQFHVNHPFLLFVSDNRFESVILFLGAIRSP